MCTCIADFKKKESEDLILQKTGDKKKSYKLWSLSGGGQCIFYSRKEPTTRIEYREN